MKRKRSPVTFRLDDRIIKYFTGVADAHKVRWGKKMGMPPTRNWFVEQILGLAAGIQEAVNWKEEDNADEQDN